jgi:hypothetical protein
LLAAAEEQQRLAAAAAAAAVAQQQQQSSAATLDAYYQLKQAQVCICLCGDAYLIRTVSKKCHFLSKYLNCLPPPVRKCEPLWDCGHDF